MLDPKRCRARAQEFLRLSALAQNAEIAARYKDLADAYSRLAEREEEPHYPLSNSAAARTTEIAGRSASTISQCIGLALSVLLPKMGYPRS